MDPKSGSSNGQSGSVLRPEGYKASQSWSSDAVIDNGAVNAPEEQPNSPPEDRASLLQQGRDFLASPAIRSQDISSKRNFLESKGLTHAEVDSLIDELTSIPPPIPPRTYISPAPPSNIPWMLMSLTQTLCYGGALSGVGMLLYQRYIYPLLNDSFEARHSLRIRGLELITQLNHGLRDLPGRALPMTVLTTHELDPTNKPQKDSSYDHGSSVDIGVAPPTTKPERLSVAIGRLSEAADQGSNSTAVMSRSTSFSRTLDSVTDLTAYISSQTYLIPAASSFRLGMGGSASSGVNALGPAEEEVRRELKALKGLVLNRRSFAYGV